MLQVSLWVRVLIGAILVGALLVITPMLLPENVRSRLPAAWANLSITLGLDLQGGSNLLLEVQLEDVQKDKIESMLIDLRHGLRKAGVLFDKTAITADSISVRGGPIPVRRSDFFLLAFPMRTKPIKDGHQPGPASTLNPQVPVDVGAVALCGGRAQVRLWSRCGLASP